MVVLLALLNDIPIMTIAYDNAPFAPRPVKWDMQRVLTVASVLGVYGVLESFVLYWLARDYFALPGPVLQAVLFLKLMVSGHMTIYLARNSGWFWQRPWPSGKLIIASELTQAIATLIVVYGVAMGARRLVLRAAGMGLCGLVLPRRQRGQGLDVSAARAPLRATGAAPLAR